MVDYKELAGRKKIVINVSKEEFENNPFGIFKDNIGSINSIRDRNNEEIEYLLKFKKGLSEILAKTKASSQTKNNITICNFAHEIVEFKKGFTVGKPIQYVNTSEEVDDSMKQFLRFIKKSKKKSKDLTKYENLYTFGIAHTFVTNKIGVLEKDEMSFTYDVIDSRKACSVYSNDVVNSKLFSMYESTILDETNKNRKVYTIYFGNKSMQIIDDTLENFKIYKDITINPYGDPITEYELNASRMGIFEPVISQLLSVNFVRSNQLDDIEEFVDSYIVFLNTDSKYIKANINDIKKNKVISLKTNNPETPADVKMLKKSLEHNDINNLFNDMVQNIFNQVGVPMATSNTGQGVSGEAQTYGGGWENAQIYANIETTYISQFEIEDLEKIVEICKTRNFVDNENFNVDDIEIKYTINKSNNILTKMQAFKYWIDLGGTFERGLELCDLSEDSHVIGEESEAHRKELALEKIQLEVEKEKQISKIQATDTKGEDE